MLVLSLVTDEANITADDYGLLQEKTSFMINGVQGKYDKTPQAIEQQCHHAGCAHVGPYF